MILIFLAIFISVSLYAVLIMKYIHGWNRLKPNPEKTRNADVPVTVVVAVRNEENNIRNLIQDLANQHYPDELYEVIIVNDHSEDNTEEIIQAMTEKLPALKFLNLKNGEHGKKAAIRIGVLHAAGKFILTTDADCRIPDNWIASYTNYYSRHQPKLLLGPVKIAGKTVFSQLQQLEMLSLMGSAAGSAGLNRPILSNGANMGFEKAIYHNADLKNMVPTGDDIFLLEYVKKQHPSQISFIGWEQAIIETKATNFYDFFHQRLRWASKSKYLRTKDIQITGWMVALSNAMLFLCLPLGFIDPQLYLVYAGGLILKSIPEYILIKKAASFFHQHEVLKYFIPVQLIYPIYATTFAFLGIFMPYRWKNRNF